MSMNTANICPGNLYNDHVDLGNDKKYFAKVMVYYLRYQTNNETLVRKIGI